MRRGVSQRVRAPEHVVLVLHLGIAPSIGAEEVEVGEGAERRQLQKDPRRHLANRVPRNERSEVGVVFQAVELSLPAVAVAVVEGCEVVGEDRVAVLVRLFGDALDQPGLRGVLHVEGQRQQEAAQLAVDGGEVDEVPEVEPGVLAVSRPAYAFGEQHAVGSESEIVILAGQDARGFRFGAQLEGDALPPQVLDLLFYCEDGLPARDIGHRRSAVIDLQTVFYQYVFSKL